VLPLLQQQRLLLRPLPSPAAWLCWFLAHSHHLLLLHPSAALGQAV
jgi:hypothetical protein